jgi:hypothetical protein
MDSKEKKREADKRYYLRHKEVRNEKSRNRLKESRTNSSVRFREYKKRAKKSDLSFSMSEDDFMLFWNKECFYCSSSIDGIGLDRVDNSLGYDLQNLVSCCPVCNYAKGQLSGEEFLSLCRRVVACYGNKISSSRY